ncbi:endonuclease NucS domain-containing protein [Brevibacillus reuszeri]|uniref:endonuclease NucS domain-containing protein n=1 Tax=Brevibacillus reuszeri TaxID=54915 RepID=UPI003D1BD2BB
MPNPYTWQMIKEAVEELGGKTSNSEIRKYIHDKYGGVKDNTINCTILTCCVNKQSRINWPENAKPRLATSQYDFLYSTGRAQVELYNRDIHGDWEIRQSDDGSLLVTQVGIDTSKGDSAHPNRKLDEDEKETETKEEMYFPWETHLRDFIAKNLSSITLGDNNTLRLYVDDDGTDGIEYHTEVGRIDILAVDQDDNFVVFELKLNRGVDSAMGQLLRYMGWIKSKFSPDKSVKGVIVASDIDEKLKYAASMVQNVTLFKYQISFSLQQESLKPS